ncbi:hypothetical protein D3C84_1195580 [compost metagenome]
MQLTLTATNVQQSDERQQGEGQTQQAFADERRQQLFDHPLPVEQPAQLPIAAAQGDCQHTVGQLVGCQHGRFG